MKLVSLESLTLAPETVDKDMLQRIISFCSLINLDITKGGLKKISLPWIRKVNEVAEDFGGGSLQSNVKASPLSKFVYYGLCEYLLWPWNINVGVLRNLRKVEIVCADITDNIVSELAYGLVALESLVLSSCLLLRCIKISSISLKEFHIIEGLDLKNVTIDAPNLLKFWYNCEADASLSLISAQDRCNAQFCPCVESISTSWLVKLKKFLIETNIFKFLVMDLSDCGSAQLILNILKEKVQCWKHPLKSIEVEGADLSGLLSRRSELEIRFKLSW